MVKALPKQNNPNCTSTINRKKVTAYGKQTAVFIPAELAYRAKIQSNPSDLEKKDVMEQDGDEMTDKVIFHPHIIHSRSFAR